MVTIFSEMVYSAPSAFTASNVAMISFDRMMFSILLVPFAKAADKIARWERLLEGGIVIFQWS